jgi:hypothetical protein
VTKNGRFLKSAGGGVGARVRKRPFLASAKKISGKNWFVLYEHEVLFCHKNGCKKSLFFTLFTFFHAFSKNKSSTNSK